MFLCLKNQPLMSLLSRKSLSKRTKSYEKLRFAQYGARVSHQHSKEL